MKVFTHRQLVRYNFRLIIYTLNGLDHFWPDMFDSIAWDSIYDYFTYE